MKTINNNLLLFIFALFILLNQSACKGENYQSSTNMNVDTELIPQKIIGWYRAVLIDSIENKKDAALINSLLYININYSNSVVYLAGLEKFYKGNGFVANIQNENEQYQSIVVDVQDKEGKPKHFIIKYFCEDLPECKVLLQASDSWPETILVKLEYEVTEEAFMMDYQNIN